MAKPTGTQRAIEFFERYATLVGFVVMFGFFWALRPKVFGTTDNVLNILDQAAPVVILAVGLTVVLSVGEFDLSFPGLVGMCAVLAVKSMADWGASPLVAILIALGTGVGGGIIAGALVATKRTSSFITTLAMNTVWGGLALGISGGGGQTLAAVKEGYIQIGSARFHNISLPVFYGALLAIVIAVMLRWTVFGRQARAIGTNPDAARLSGIRLFRSRTIAFAIMGLCSGVVAIILSAKTAQYTPDIASGLFIPPFVAAFFGISVLARGTYNVFGTVIGALFIGTLETGLIVAGSQAWVGDMVVGAALLLILFVASETRSRR